MIASLSIIIPTLNEAKNLPALLKALGRTDAEILIVDGGSTDRTVTCAIENGAKIVSSERGRGQQLKTGVENSTGDIIWFLHADTLPGPGAIAAIRRSLEDPNLMGGNFRIVFDGNDPFSNWLTRFYAWFRAKGLYYGDSGIFIRRDALAEIGGVLPIALMEDFDLSRRMERTGRTICIEDPPVISSSRRFKSRRRWRIFLQWLWIHTLYYLRVDGKRLARLYRSEEHSPAVQNHLKS